MKKINCFILCVIMLCVMIISQSNQSIAYASAMFEDMSAQSYVVVDTNDKILIEKNKDEKREVASICKLMTILLTLDRVSSDNLSLDSKLQASEYACAVEGSQAFLDAGSMYCVGDLLKSVIVASANDSAIVLAEGLAGSESNFVHMMNEKAKSLNMTNTLYSNSTGLSGKTQYSTAYDTAILLNEVSKYDIYREYCQIWMDELIHPSGRKTELVNTNRLIKYYDYCVTGKTGFTDEAGYCLSSTACKDNMKLTCVVLGCRNSADRFKNSVELYNYAYANFMSKQIIDQNEKIINNVSVVGSLNSDIELHASEDFYLTQNRNSNDDIEINYILPSKIKAPIKCGEIIGELEIFVNKEKIKEIDIVSGLDIFRQSYMDSLYKVMDNFGLIK